MSLYIEAAYLENGSDIVLMQRDSVWQLYSLRRGRYVGVVGDAPLQLPRGSNSSGNPI